MATKPLKLLERVLTDFSKCGLKSLDNRADFDSAIRRFESSRPSQTFPEFGDFDMTGVEADIPPRSAGAEIGDRLASDSVARPLETDEYLSGDAGGVKPGWRPQPLKEPSAADSEAPAPDSIQHCRLCDLNHSAGCNCATVWSGRGDAGLEVIAEAQILRRITL
jgi:hypothetical protein